MEPQAIFDVMGQPPQPGFGELRAEIAEGLPLDALHETVGRVFPDPVEARRFILKMIPEGSYKRRVRSGRLSALESERTARLANVVALAAFVWDDPDAARRFLVAPHPELGGAAPVEVAIDEFGARHVEEILEGILHGIPA